MTGSSKSLSFDGLIPALSESLLEVITSKDHFDFSKMTPVQAASIPLFLNHKDVLVEATTGSGKTLAFAVPVVEILLNNFTISKIHNIGAMILAPSRELALQINEIVNKLINYSHKLRLRCQLFVGGTPIQNDIQEFEKYGAQILVGTPGRMMDIINRCTFMNLKTLEVLVLDEADTLLDLGFQNTINQILSLLPKQRRTGLFSATQTKEVKALARAGMRNPVSITVNVKINHAHSQQQNNSSLHISTPSTLENWFTVSDYKDRPELLVNFLSTHKNEKIIIFVSTCACVDYFSTTLSRIVKEEIGLLPIGLNIFGFHGKMVPKKRTALYRKFLNSTHGVLFSTDVAARGIDIPDVDWIIQMSAPKDPDFFIHRIGRTARAGKKGNSLLFITREEISYVEFLRGRGIILTEKSNIDLVASYADGKNHTNIHEELKNLSKKDRAILELSSTAFMSFLRAYKEHQCSYIFRFDRLNLGSVAKCYALLKLPKIKETKDMTQIDFIPEDVDIKSIPYRQKDREIARQKRLLKFEQDEKTLISTSQDIEPENESDTAIVQVSGSVETNLKDKNKYQEKKLQKDSKVLDNQNNSGEKRKRKKKLSFTQKIDQEWDEFAAEEALFKKYKRGHLTKEEYEESLINFSVPSEAMNESSDVEEYKSGKGTSRKISKNGRVDYRNKGGRKIRR